jgi:hypothetical protein
MWSDSDRVYISVTLGATEEQRGPIMRNDLLRWIIKATFLCPWKMWAILGLTGLVLCDLQLLSFFSTFTFSIPGHSLSKCSGQSWCYLPHSSSLNIILGRIHLTMNQIHTPIRDSSVSPVTGRPGSRCEWTFRSTGFGFIGPVFSFLPRCINFQLFSFISHLPERIGLASTSHGLFNPGWVTFARHNDFGYTIDQYRHFTSSGSWNTDPVEMPRGNCHSNSNLPCRSVKEHWSISLLLVCRLFDLCSTGSLP